jgi:hypothetical protein
MPARGQFSLNRRTKLSNFSDVGQIRVSRGISTKMRTTPVTLVGLAMGSFGVGGNEQANDRENDEEGGVKDIGNS